MKDRRSCPGKTHPPEMARHARFRGTFLPPPPPANAGRGQETLRTAFSQCPLPLLVSCRAYACYCITAPRDFMIVGICPTHVTAMGSTPLLPVPRSEPSRAVHAVEPCRPSGRPASAGHGSFPLRRIREMVNQILRGMAREL